MRQNVIKVSALLAFVVAACSEPTATEQGQASSAAPKAIGTSIGGQLNIVAGNHKIAAAGAFPSIDQSVQVLDAAGNPQVGAAVVFTTVTKTGATRSAVGFGTTCSLAGLTLNGGGTTITVNTGSNGIATVRWCYIGIGGQEMTVSFIGSTVTFFGIATTSGAGPSVEKLQGDVAGTNNLTMGGQPVPINPVIRVLDTDGVTPLGGIPVVFTASGDGLVSGGTCSGFCNGPTVYTGAAGLGQASVRYQLRTTAGTNVLTVTIPTYTTTAGVPITGQTFTSTSATLTGLGVGTSITCVAGCSNSVVGIAGTQFAPRDPAIAITTAAGAAVVGAGVTVTYGTGTNACGSGLTGQVLTQTLLTNASGRVAAPWCVATGGVATRTITFSSGNLSVTISGNQTSDFQTNNGTLTIDAGTGFTCTVGQAASLDLAVTFADAQGSKISGATITFTAPGDGSLSYLTSSGRVLSVTTNSAGQAAVRFTCGTTSGALAVTVVSTTNAQANITGTASAGAARTILIMGGDNQTKTAGTAVTKNPTVKVVDQYGNAVDGVSTTWTPSGVGGSVSQTVIATGNVGQGSVPGVAANVWTLSTTAGANTLTVSATGLTSVTFNATGN